MPLANLGISASQLLLLSFLFVLPFYLLQVIPDDTRDRAEALLLLARATIEKSRANPGGRRGRASPSEALETGIGHLRAALEVQCVCFRGLLPMLEDKTADPHLDVSIRLVAGCPKSTRVEMPATAVLHFPRSRQTFVEPRPRIGSLSACLPASLPTRQLKKKHWRPKKRPARRSSWPSARSSTGTSAA